jgi:hypothetical protein
LERRLLGHERGEPSTKVAERGGEVLTGPYDIPNTGFVRLSWSIRKARALSLAQPPGTG